MCVGNPTYFLTAAGAQPANLVVYPTDAAAAGTATAAIPLTFTIGGSRTTHACPSCKCFQVQP